MPRVDECESLSAIDGLVLDLQPQFLFDQLAELAMFCRVVRIDPEQELLIVRVEKGPSAQGGRMWPDTQTAPEFIDVRLVELPELLAIDCQLAAYDPGWAEARVSQAQSRGRTTGKAVVSPRAVAPRAGCASTWPGPRMPTRPRTLPR